MRLRALVACTLLMVGAVAPSPPPRAVPQETGAQAEDTRNAEEEGDGAQRLSAYERASLTVDRAANRIAQEGNRIAGEQAAYGLGSLVMAAVAAGSAIAAAIFAWRAVFWTREAAKTAERALTNLERPFLALEIVKSDIKVDKIAKSIKYGETTYRLRNYGRAPAILVWRHFAFETTDGVPEPIDPKSGIGKAVAYGILVGPGDSSKEWTVDPALPVLSRVQLIKEGRSTRGLTVLFLGFVRYRDLMGNEYETGFCLQHHGDDGFDVASWVEPGGEDLYNYDRKLK